MSVGPDNRNGTHARLEDMRVRLQRIHSSLADFQPLTAKPPILDSSLDVDREDTEDRYWLQPEVVPGLKNLKDAVKRDLGVLEKVGPESPQKTQLKIVISSSSSLIRIAPRCRHCQQMHRISLRSGTRC
jgi:hypothetical protein